MSPSATTGHESPELAHARRLSHALDAQFRIPGTRVRFGWDGIIGLIPGVGDLAGAAISAYIMLRAKRMGAPSGVLARMAGNIALDAVVGTIPLVGDAFDVAFKANKRNLRLLESWAERSTSRSSPLRAEPAS